MVGAGPALATHRTMRPAVLILVLLAGCDARAGAETALAFTVLAACLMRVLADPEAR